MSMSYSRRRFVANAALWGIAASFSGARRAIAAETPLFSISLAQWSLHRALRAGELDNLDFAAFTKKQFGIEAVEYVNQFFKDRANDRDYLGQMKTRAADAGVKSLLIMVDGEGQLGDPNEAARTKTVENHYRWIEAAQFLGCHSIRVNAASKGSFEEQQKLAADGLRRVAEFGAKHDINVIVENHGGLSSNGAWLAGVIKHVGLANCGTLPDFGNFVINREKDESYDRYQSVKELMPYAKAVSAKSYDFDEAGNETTMDFRRLVKIVLDAGYRGYFGIEYEGKRLPEVEGIRATQRLLEKIRQEAA